MYTAPSPPNVCSVVRVYSAIAVQAAMTELGAEFETETKIKVDFVFDTNPAVARRIENGEPFDLTITNPHLIAGLIGSGLVQAASQVSFGRSPMGIAAPTSSSPIDITSTAAFARVVLDAKSIGYSSDGTSGRRFIELLDRLDILASVRSKLRPLAGGMAGTAVAEGVVDIAIAPLTTILAAAPGVKIAGLLPSSGETEIEFDIAIGSRVQNLAAARAFLQFLKSPRIDALIAGKGIERTAAHPSI